MMLPLSVAVHQSVSAKAQVPASVLPGQTEPDLTDEQKAAYDIDLAALLLQLQPETQQPIAGAPDNDMPAQTTIQPDQVPLLLSVPQQHFLQQTAEYQLSQSLSLTASIFKTADVAVLTSTQPQSGSVVLAEVEVIKNLLNAAVFVPTSVAGTSAPQLSVVAPNVSVPKPSVTAVGTSLPLLSAAASGTLFLPETPPVLVAATESMAPLQTKSTLHTSVPVTTVAFTASEQELLTVTTPLEQLKAQMPPQSNKANSAHIQPLFSTASQSLQQAVVHTPPVSHAMLATQFWNSFAAATESSQLSSQPSGLSPALASVPQVSYQWQSEPMPADPVRFGQRLLTLLSDKVDVQLGLGVNKAMIRLDPPSLGSIELAVQLDGEKLTVHLNSNNAQLKEAMQQGLDQLRASLQLRLGSDAQIDVRMGPDAQSQQHRDQGAQAQDKIAANIAGVEQAEDVEIAQSATMGLVNQLV